MKNLSPRQREIINLFKQKLDVSALDIQLALNISQATVYREMQNLVKLGYAQRIPGGISRIEPATPDRCVQCHRQTNPRLAFALALKNGQAISACCAHCGLLALHQRDDVTSAMTADFFYGTMLSASQAWYVLESVVGPCCHPSVLSFANRVDADRFAGAFEGRVVDFTQARRETYSMMAFTG